MVSRETLLRNASLIPLLLLAVMFMAAFRVGDLTELDSFLERDANSHFPRSSQNVQLIVQQGTDGVVTAVKPISVGHWAVEVEVRGGPMAKQHQGQKVWFLVKKSELTTSGEYGALRFNAGKTPNLDAKATIVHDSPAIIQLVNPKTESVAESASQSGPSVEAEQKPQTRAPASGQAIPIFY